METRVRLRSIGRIEGLPREVQRALRESEELTAANAGMTLCLALNYGAQTEIADAARRLAEDRAAGRVSPADLERPGAVEAALAARLYQPDMPPLDLLVRTAGEQRLSNFLLWQASYAEIHISEVCWPDFREEDLDGALADYATRVRRFGGLVKG
jgi:undecaprenyl diphosphate synthase